MTYPPTSLKSILFTTCYLDGNDTFGQNRLERMKRYLYYYRPLKELLGFEQFYLVDNASPPELIKQIEAPDVIIYHFDEHLSLGGGTNNYPYMWRAFYHVAKLFDRWEKVICIVDDCFVLSQRLAKLIKETNTGFYSFWSHIHKHPADEIKVLCQDELPRLEKWMAENTWEERNASGKRFEEELPFTQLYREFNGDRFGMEGRKQTQDMDFYSQAMLKIPLTFQW